MKRLKTALCALMVFALLLGLGAPALAVFTDSADITYTRAVDLMTGIGIIEGFTDGSFQPKGSLTRAQAAKIIAYLNLGKAAGDSMAKSTGATEFSDVKVGHWASGYINYCAGVGIIAGDGHGHFMPERQLTAYEFAKMLLVSLGYGVNDEFIGAEWKRNVSNYAMRIKLFEGNYAAVGDAVCTREEAMLYAYNALFADKVTYAKVLDTYINTSGSGIFGGTGEKLGTLADNYGISFCKGTVEYSNGYYIDGYEDYPDVTGYEGSPDDIGREVELWCQRVGMGAYQPVTDVTFTDTVLATLYDGTGMYEWTTRNSGVFLGQAAPQVDYYVNGQSYGSAEPFHGRGDKAVIIDSDGDKRIDKVLITTYTAATAGNRGAYVTTNQNGTFVVIPGVGRTGIGSDNFTTGVEASRVEGYADIAAGDLVFYSYNHATGTYQFHIAQAIPGQKVSETTKNGVVTISFAGFGNLADSDIPLSSTTCRSGVHDMPFNTDVTLYLDAGGFVIGYETTQVVIRDYCLLVDMVKVGGIGLSTSAHLEARLVFPDGRTQDVTVSSLTSGRTTYDAASVFPAYSIINNAEYNHLVGTFYSYYVTAAGEYVLADAGAVEGGNTIYNGAVLFDGSNAASNQTVFIVATRAANGTYAYQAYTGYANVPSSGVGGVTTRILKEGLIATYVYVDAYYDTGANASNIQYVYICSGSAQTYQDNATRQLYTVYQAVLNGMNTTLKVWQSNSASARTVDAGLYEVVFDKSDFATIYEPGYASPLHNYYGAAVSSESGVLILSAGLRTDAYAIDNRTVFYIVDANGNVSIGSLTDVASAAVTQVSVRTQGTAGNAAQVAVEVYVHY